MRRLRPHERRAGLLELPFSNASSWFNDLVSLISGQRSPQDLMIHVDVAPRQGFMKRPNG
jgi:hypothetical protein